jgi:hypothetical protein
MPLDAETMEKIEVAVDKALVEFRELAKENPEMAAKFVAWFKKNYVTATHKYLGRGIVNVLARELGVK